MGLFSGKQQAPPPPLPPAPHAIGAFPQYTAHSSEYSLKLREKKISFSGDDFAIKDAATGQHMFQVNGKAFSIGSRKEFTDSKGHHLFTLKKEHFHLKPTYAGVDANGQTLFTIKAALFTFGANLTVKFRNVAHQGEEAEFVVQGDWFDRRAEITYNGVPVGRIGRQFFNAGEMFFDQQTYVLTCAPGVDCALLAAICVALDERENEK